MQDKIEWKHIIQEDSIYYSDSHELYGRAEFGFCVVRKAGNFIKEIFIHAQQQVRDDLYYIYIPTFDVKHFSFNSWTYKGIENPWAWRYSWCEDHDALNISVYVPSGTSKLRVDQSSTKGISFYFEN